MRRSCLSRLLLKMSLVTTELASFCLVFNGQEQLSAGSSRPETASLSLLFLILNKIKSSHFFRKVRGFLESLLSLPAVLQPLQFTSGYDISFAALTVAAYIRYITMWTQYVWRQSFMESCSTPEFHLSKRVPCPHFTMVLLTCGCLDFFPILWHFNFYRLHSVAISKS